MQPSTIRIALVAFFLGGCATGTYFLWSLERDRRALEASGRAFDHLAEQTFAELAELQQAQQAYVAAGQAPASWMSRSDRALAALSSNLVALKQGTADQSTASSLGSASQNIDNLAELDRRVREYARNGQLLMASDIIYTDGLQTGRSAGSHLQAARDRSRVLLDETSASLRRRQLAIGGTLGGACLLVIALLVRAIARTAGREKESLAPREPAEERPVSPDLLPAPDQPVPVLVPSAPNGPPPVVEAASTLSDLALLCGDLARAESVSDVSGLLGRVGTLLDASGVIVWLAESTGATLRPALAHGYPPQTLARIPNIAPEESNATARAFRERRIQIVRSSDDASGALALPILAGASCIGVLAAEMPHGGETLDVRQAIAAVVAAQLSGLAGTTPVEEQPARHASSGA
jgi:hypothetical protein